MQAMYGRHVATRLGFEFAGAPEKNVRSRVLTMQREGAYALDTVRDRCSSVAGRLQLSAHLGDSCNRNAGVGGSIPPSSTNKVILPAV